MNRTLVLAAASVYLLAASSAHAQNLVLNPGFETGDLTGWTIVLGNPTVVTSPVNSGSYAGELYKTPDQYGNEGTSRIYQNLTLAAAPTVLTFWADSPLGGSLGVLLDGTILVTTNLPSSTGYVEFTYNGTVATAGSEQLQFSFSPGTSKPLYLDDVSVTQIPEPTTIGLVAIGLLGALTIRRRKV